MIIMNKFIKELVQIGYELMENNPNFDKIDKKLTQIEKEMNENQTKSSNYDIIIIEKEKNNLIMI